MQDTLTKARQRAATYKLLSECYYLPDNALIQKVVDAVQVTPIFSELCPCIPSYLEPLKIDFTRLFIGPFKVLAPPYGSVYLEDGRMMGESTIDVRNWYEKDGLDVVLNDAPDHIAMELEYGYYLVVKQIQATNERNLQDFQHYQQKQKMFLCSHLARWLPRFAKNVQENAQTEFYRKLAQLTEMFVQKDLEACTLFDIQQGYPASKD
ncbi:MAG: TorD/DmsD family molecular chaperone [Planctomycetota bacterium]|jgi:TorA maturation chaperone TorD